MTRLLLFGLLVPVLLLTQCKASREVMREEPLPLVGMEGLRAICRASDTIRNILISKAETLIISEDERYEATVTIYAVKDSFIYISAVNGGFEILRAAVDQDSVTVIDRLNKVVYKTPLKRRFGYQNPVNFADVQNIISRYFICDYIDQAKELDFNDMEFHFDEPNIRKCITFNRESLRMDKFDFFHMQTNKYIKGERAGENLRIFSNFMITDFEIVAKGGTTLYNRELAVKMDVNPRKYNVINL
jgi:hypothetical protein